MALPINDTIVAAVAQLIDDSKSNGQYRDPTHSDIDFYVNQAGLAAFDPKGQGQTVGKAKRLRAILHEALEKNLSGGPMLIASILSKVWPAADSKDTMLRWKMESGGINGSKKAVQPRVQARGSEVG